MSPQRPWIGITAIILLLAWPGPAPQAGWKELLQQVEEQAAPLLQSENANATGGLDRQTLIRGLKQALEIGTRRAVEQVSATDGYLANPEIRIPLPGPVNQGALLLQKFGMDSLVKDFERSMNRAAEQAAPEATAIFLEALQGLTIEDAQAIYEGPDDAATRYFEGQTRDRLSATLKPLIVEHMQQVGVTRYYQQLVDEASRYPLVGDMELNLENHVTRHALDGLFQVLAQEEQKIRDNPQARTTELLKQLFGN